MSLPSEKFSLSVADYLAGERAAAVRHEYVSGRAYAMIRDIYRNVRFDGEAKVVSKGIWPVQLGTLAGRVEGIGE
jgi:hypothetical protein